MAKPGLNPEPNTKRTAWVTSAMTVRTALTRQGPQQEPEATNSKQDRLLANKLFPFVNYDNINVFKCCCFYIMVPLLFLL